MTYYSTKDRKPPLHSTPSDTNLPVMTQQEQEQQSDDEESEDDESDYPDEETLTNHHCAGEKPGATAPKSAVIAMIRTRFERDPCGHCQDRSNNAGGQK